MYGQGIARGLLITLKHVARSYMDDIRYAGAQVQRRG